MNRSGATFLIGALHQIQTDPGAKHRYEHSEVRERRWVRYIVGRSRRLVRYAG